MDRAGRVTVLDPVVSSLEVDTVTGLIAHRPEDDRGVVLIAIDHTFDAVHMGFSPTRILGERLGTVAHAVGFDVALIDNVEAVTVTEVVPARIVGVVACADGVDVELFHEERCHGSLIRVRRRGLL